MQKILPLLSFPNKNYRLFIAGLPTFKQNFSRDSFYAGLIMQDTELLKNQALFSAKNQGAKTDPFTGEEKGKIHHELPGVVLHQKSTLYAACDTTGLFILGAAQVIKNQPEDQNFKVEILPFLKTSVEYILNHIDENGIFWEDPKFSESEHYALKVTYWKDSVLAFRDSGEPSYPVTYLVNQAINLAALRAVKSLFLDDFSDLNLENAIDKMLQGLQSLYSQTEKTFAIARDSEGDIFTSSSDILHFLYFLEPGDLSSEQLESIKKTASELTTVAGFRVNDPNASNNEDKYHSCTLWPFEQAIIHHGLQKFGLDDEAKIAARILPYIKEDENLWELFYVYENDVLSPTGCNPQLWTLAARKYFLEVEGGEG